MPIRRGACPRDIAARSGDGERARYRNRWLNASPRRDPRSNADGPGLALLGPALQDRVTVQQSAVCFAVYQQRRRNGCVGALHEEIAMSLLAMIKPNGPSGFGYGSTAEDVTEGLSLNGKA